MRKGFVVLGFAALLAALTAGAGCSRAKAQTQGAGEPEQTSAMAAVAAPGAGAPGDAAAKKPFGEHCVEDTECSGGVCFHKRIKTPDAGHEKRGSNDAVEHDGYCSMKCDEDTDCPVPPTRGKCGARGMCKRAAAAE